jgi:hypothetical protein
MDRLGIMETDSIISPLFFSLYSKTAKRQIQLARKTNFSRYNADLLRVSGLRLNL